MRPLVAAIFTFGLAWMAPGTSGMAEKPEPVRPEVRLDGIAGTAGSGITEYSYSMTARIRLLLFWLNFKNVGMGRIQLSAASDGEVDRIELLIGSDPLRAPLKVNRWGYLVEERHGPRFNLFGVMTQTDEESADQAKRNLQSVDKVHIFKTIRTRVEGGVAENVSQRVSLDTDFTIRDLEALIPVLPTSGGKARHLSIPAGTEPGFLIALTGLIRSSVAEFRRTGKAEPIEKGRSTYVFNGELHELTLNSARLKGRFKIDHTTYRSVIESEFRTRKIASKEAEEFKITYGTEGLVAGIPLSIVYRPKWWFEAVLKIDIPAAEGHQDGILE